MLFHCFRGLNQEHGRVYLHKRSPWPTASFQRTHPSTAPRCTIVLSLSQSSTLTRNTAGRATLSFLSPISPAITSKSKANMRSTVHKAAILGSAILAAAAPIDNEKRQFSGLGGSPSGLPSLGGGDSPFNLPSGILPPGTSIDTHPDLFPKLTYIGGALPTGGAGGGLPFSLPAGGQGGLPTGLPSGGLGGLGEGGLGGGSLPTGLPSGLGSGTEGGLGGGSLPLPSGLLSGLQGSSGSGLGSLGGGSSSSPLSGLGSGSSLGSGDSPLAGLGDSSSGGLSGSGLGLEGTNFPSSYVKPRQAEDCEEGAGSEASPASPSETISEVAAPTASSGAGSPPGEYGSGSSIPTGTSGGLGSVSSLVPSGGSSGLGSGTSGGLGSLSSLIPSGSGSGGLPSGSGSGLLGLGKSIRKKLARIDLHRDGYKLHRRA